MRKLVWLLPIAAVLAGCSPEPKNKPYTGKFKLDSGTEYVALETPSSIGGACKGWNTVDIRKTGQTYGGMSNLLCWKRDGDTITITAGDGKQQTAGPAAVWSD